MKEDAEKPESEDDEENKENLEDSRAETSMSNSTCLPGTGRVENMEATVDSEGKLDLSQQRLTNLARNFKEEYRRVRYLDVHGNDFQMFTYMKMFETCEVMDASDCQINKFTADWNYHLRELNLAGNQLKQVAQLNQFENLTALDLSQNHIEEPIALTLKKLETLNLSCNSLDRLLDLSKCTQLQSLNLSGNKINDLTDMSKMICPNNLTDFSISANLIDDLSQFSNLAPFRKLAHVFIAGNPCITEVIKKEKFNYRSYIFACCSGSLERIDDEEIDDVVKTEGEWLVLQGRICKIGAGHHEQLCEQLSLHFPENGQVPPTPAQKSCHKAMEKRKSSQLDSDRTVNSVYSPCQDWTGKFEKHCNLNRSLGDDMLTPVRRNSRQKTPGSQNIRMCSPPEARKNRSFTFRNDNSSAVDPADDLELPPSRPMDSRTNSTETVILSSRTETCLSLDDRSEITPLPVIESPPTVTPSAFEAEASKTKSRSVSAATSRRSPSVADVSIVADPSDHLNERVRHLERKVTELAKQNENLTTTNNLLTEMLEEFQADRMKMWQAIRGSIPKPENMSSSLFAEAEDGSQTHIVRWEMPLVKGFEIHVDGNSCGRVVGKNSSARITDLDSSKPHSVQIQAIGLSGEKGAMSAKLRIDPDL